MFGSKPLQSQKHSHCERLQDIRLQFRPLANHAKIA